MSQLPAWQVEALQFGAKLLRGSPAVDKQLDLVLAMDPLIPAESMFQSESWQKAKLFDFKDVLEQRRAALQPAPEPKVQEPVPIEEVKPVEPKNPDASEEPEAMPQIMADVESDDEQRRQCVPQKIDRLASFNLLEIPTDVISTLQGGEDSYFEQVLDWARVRVNTFVDFEVKARTAAGKRQQVKELYERHGGTPFFIVYDVKCRLHVKDDLVSYPWKRPTPLNLTDFKQWLSAFWLDPKLMLVIDCFHDWFFQLTNPHECLCGRGFKCSGKLRKDKATPQFRSQDVFVAMDGRSPTNSDAISKALTGVLKAIDSMPKRLFTVLRRSYTNSEFAKGGYAAPRRKSSLHPQAPDPLENAYIVVTKEFSMPHRESSLPAVVVDNFSRGWQAMDMKTRMDHGFTMVSLSVHKSLQDAEEP